MPVRPAWLLLFTVPTACAFVRPPSGVFLPASSHRASASNSNGALLSLSRTAEAEKNPGAIGVGRPVEDVHGALSDALWNVNYIMNPEFWHAPTTPAVLKSFYEETLTTGALAKESTIPEAGLGLFAARDLEKGTIVALYPTHTLGINFFNGGSEWVALDSDDQDYFMAASENDEPNYSLFLLGNRKEEAEFDEAMIVDCNPNRPDLAGWMAHRINDGATVLSNDERGALLYLKQSVEKQNVVIAPYGPSPLLAAFTTRDVEEGEELFTSYGLSYWWDASFPKNEWVEKTDTIKSKEKLLFEKYLYYSQAGLYQREADALATIFDEL
jgi:hypothetical protein